MVSSATQSGSRVAASAAVQKAADIGGDTLVDVTQSAIQDKKVTAKSVITSLAVNTITAGYANGSAKQATGAVADSTQDNLEREAKDAISAKA